jgi:hypothetical protein
MEACHRLNGGVALKHPRIRQSVEAPTRFVRDRTATGRDAGE